MTEHIEPNDELHWLAFRYVAGELTDFEQDAFEKRLADDQDARETVEQAVEVQQAVAIVSVEPQFAGRSARRSDRLRVAWAGAAAACLVLAVGLLWLMRPHAPSIHSSPTANSPNQAVLPNYSQDSTSLASAWTDIRHARTTEDSGFGFAERNDAPASAQMTSGIAENGQPDAIPSWLLSAVLAETQQLKEKP